MGGRYVEGGRLATRSLPRHPRGWDPPRNEKPEFQIFYKASKILEARRPLKSCGSARDSVCRPVGRAVVPPPPLPCCRRLFPLWSLCVCVVLCWFNLCSRRRPADSTIISQASQDHLLTHPIPPNSQINHFARCSPRDELHVDPASEVRR